MVEMFSLDFALPKLCSYNRADQGNNDVRCEQTCVHHATPGTPFLPLVFIA